MAPPSAPLVVTEARLRDGAVVDLHCAGGLVTAVVPTGTLPVPVGGDLVEAAGGLVTEPFVDAHLHLDKVRTLPLIGDTALQAYTADGMADSARGIDLARAVKQHYRVSTSAKAWTWRTPNRSPSASACRMFGSRASTR